MLSKSVVTRMKSLGEGEGINTVRNEEQRESEMQKHGLLHDMKIKEQTAPQTRKTVIKG